jgi:hypothetical protein
MAEKLVSRPGANRAPGSVRRETTRTRYCAPPLFGCDGAGVNGCGDDEPEPVVLGGVAGRLGVLAVLEGEEPVLAVLLLLFQPATIRKPISNNTATPAIQPHIPPTLSSRRTTGSLSLGSVKRGSVMGHPPRFGTLCVILSKGNPPAIAAVPNELRFSGNQIT